MTSRVPSELPGTTASLRFRAARPTDAVEMTRLALRSKAHWGYSSAFMRACRDELTVTAKAIGDDGRYYEVALDGAELVGFYALEDQCEDRIELGAMFVEPGRIGTGVGRLLMQRAITYAARLGARLMEIVADPHALAFYRAAGATHCGECPSGSIPGRMLPLLGLDLPPDESTLPA